MLFGALLKRVRQPSVFLGATQVDGAVLEHINSWG